MRTNLVVMETYISFQSRCRDFNILEQTK